MSTAIIEFKFPEQIVGAQKTFISGLDVCEERRLEARLKSTWQKLVVGNGHASDWMYVISIMREKCKIN